MHMNSVGFFSVSGLLKMKIKLYHTVRFPLHLFTHCYFHCYQYVFTLPAVILLSWRERKGSQVLLILTLEINVDIKWSVNIIKANLTFRKISEMGASSYTHFDWNQSGSGNVGITICCTQHEHIRARVFSDLLWTISKGLGKAYEMAIRKLPSGQMKEQKQRSYLP